MAGQYSVIVLACLRQKKYDLSLISRKPVFGVPARSNTNQTVQPQKMARGLKFWNYVEDGLCYVAKTKEQLISCAVTMQLICAFVFAYAKAGFLIIGSFNIFLDGSATK